jgi:flagellar motor component MotA
MEDVPFDLQPLRVIIYDKDDPAWGTKLRANLVASLGETVSDSTNAVPPMFRKKVKSQAPEEIDTQTRLNNLERQMATLRLDELIGFGTSFSKPPRTRAMSAFINGLKRLTSREMAVEVVREALKRGIPRSIARQRLEKALSIEEAARVLELALGNPDVFA